MRVTTGRRNLSIFLIIIQVLTAGIYVYERSMLGFPDGHLTAYDRFSKVSFSVFAGLHFFSALFCFVLVLISQNQKRATVVFSCGFVVVLYLLAIVTQMWAFNNLERGLGG